MDQKLHDHYMRRIDHLDARTEPPQGFPDFPIIGTGRYIDPEFYELEQTHLFRKTWLIAGHVDEIPDPGCYKTWNHAGEPVVLFHGADGEIRAFYNVCRHRGAVITAKETGRTRTLACAYHGWVYDNKGELVSIRDQRDFPNFDPKCYGLVPIRTEMMGNIIFVNFDDDAPTLREVHGQVYDDFINDYALDECRLVDHFVWDAKANWKLLLEGGLEGYHLNMIHRQTLPNCKPNQGLITLYPGGSSSDCFLTLPYQDESGREINALARAAGDTSVAELVDDRPLNPRINAFSNENGIYCSVFPNIQFGPFYAPGFTMSCYWPVSLTTSHHEFYVFGYGERGQARSKVWDRDIKQGRDVLQEDLDFIQMVQDGIASRGNKGCKLAYQEARIYHFNEAIDETIGRDRIPPALQVEKVIGPEWIFPNDIDSYDADMDRVERLAAE